MALAEGAKISTASNPSAAAFWHPAAKSFQKTNGPPLASLTTEMVTADFKMIAQVAMR